jgi:hypothetical protein
VQIQQNNHGWDSHVIEFFAVGTAVVRESQPADLPAPQLILSLNDPAPTVIQNTVPPPVPARH